MNYPELNFEGKRTYVCSNFQSGTVRGFHYHDREQKIFICLKGAVKFVLLNGVQDGRNRLGLTPQTFVLSENSSKALYIPAKYANAWQSLTDDTVLLGISDVTVEESINDDKRFDPKVLQNVWEVRWR